MQCCLIYWIVYHRGGDGMEMEVADVYSVWRPYHSMDIWVDSSAARDF